MADKAIDLGKLKDEIHIRKNQKGIVSSNLGEAQVKGAMPKDVFLHELATSVIHGKESQATNILKEVEHKAAVMAGETRAPITNSGVKASELGGTSARIPTTSNPNPPVATGGDRDYLLYEELERKKKEMLHGGAASLAVNPQAPQTQQQGGFITENKLYEAVDEVIKDKFAHIVEHAMKDSIVDIYAATRMKETINESRDLIKEIVKETIRELQEASKKKKAQS